METEIARGIVMGGAVLYAMHCLCLVLLHMAVARLRDGEGR
jgi:hypothetical protein